VKELKLALIGAERVATIVESGRIYHQPSALVCWNVTQEQHTQRSEKRAQPHTAHSKDQLPRARLIGDRHTANIVLSPLLPCESLQVLVVLLGVCLAIAVAAEQWRPLVDHRLGLHDREVFGSWHC
jgi:hypothetical protein